MRSTNFVDTTDGFQKSSHYVNQNKSFNQ